MSHEVNTERATVSKKALSSWLNKKLSEKEDCTYCFKNGYFDHLQCAFDASEILYKDSDGGSCNWKLASSSYFCEEKGLCYVMVGDIIVEAKNSFNIETEN